MYIDILSADAYGRFNRKLAKLTNLQTACYWSEVLSIITKVVKKKKFDENGFFEISRSYVEEQLSMPTADQVICDAVLQKLGVLDIDPINPNKLRVRLETMQAILVEDDLNELKNISKVAKVSRADKTEGKRIGIIHRLQESILETDIDLLEAYKNWVEVVYDKGVCRVPQVKIFIDTINKYSNNKEVKLEIIKLCTSLSYREAAWGIQQFEKQYKPGTKLGQQKIGTSIDKTIEF